MEAFSACVVCGQQAKWDGTQFLCRSCRQAVGVARLRAAGDLARSVYENLPEGFDPILGMELWDFIQLCRDPATADEWAKIKDLGDRFMDRVRGLLEADAL